MIGVQEFIVSKYCCLFDNCGKEYSTKINLKRHILTNHLKVKNFPCPTCSRVFKSKQILKEHAYLHSGAKPYECHLCTERFRHVSSLCLHIKHHRAGLIDEQSIRIEFEEKETQTSEDFSLN